MEKNLVRVQLPTTENPHVAVVFLTNAPANAYSYDMMRQLDSAILDLRMNDAVHAIVLAGEGEKFFCAGADIAMLQGVTPGFKYAFCLHANETLNRLEQTSKLVIAAVNGHCVGGGLEIAMAADLRVAWKNPKIKVGLPEVHLGVLPGTGGTARLTRLIGKSAALHWMIEGDNIDVDAAVARGVFHKTLAAETASSFLSSVLAYASTFCPPTRASMSVAHIKRSVQSGGEMSFEGHQALERELQQRLFESDDAKEGMAANREARKPIFRGH
jgi:enoyl-CoA hydratase